MEPRALWVEDSDTDQLLMKMAGEGTALETQLDVESDFDGGVARLRAAAANGTPYALVVVDMRLGLRDGTDLVNLAVAEVGDARQQYVVLSGSDDPQDLDRITAAGAAHRRKPASFDLWRELAADFARSLDERAGQ